MLHKALQVVDQGLDRLGSPVPWSTVLLSGFVAIVVYFGLAAAALQTAFYTPDSWAYLELARTVFGDEFYVFTTWRSYLSETHSISFPFAYPVAIALVQLLTGDTPLAALWLNVFLVALVWVLCAQQAVRLGVPAFAALVISTGLLLWPPYVNEAFAGRSMPLAILFLLLALASFQVNRHLLGGICLGLAALTRFDYLPVVVLFIAGVYLLGRRSPKETLRWVAGALIGASPWVIYSLLHFGRFWASDNSWVALAAEPAFVTDFPPAAVPTLFDAPADWVARVFGNLPALFSALFTAVKSFPTLPALLVVAVIAVRQVPRGQLVGGGIAILLTGASLAPFVLTGYFDQRYFSATLLSSSLVLAAVFAGPARPWSQALLAGVLAWVLFDGGGNLVASASANAKRIRQGTFDRNAAALQAVKKCHLYHPGSTLIFPGAGTSTFASRYGAVTGMPSALLPRNFPRMTPEQQQAYFSFIEPYFLVDSTFEARACGPAREQQQLQQQQQQEQQRKAQQQAEQPSS
jgi:hypothetical protein